MSREQIYTRGTESGCGGGGGKGRGEGDRIISICSLLFASTMRNVFYEKYDLESEIYWEHTVPGPKLHYINFHS